MMGPYKIAFFFLGFIYHSWAGPCSTIFFFFLGGEFDHLQINAKAGEEIAIQLSIKKTPRRREPS